MKTLADLEAAIRASGAHVVSIRMTDKRGIVLNVRQTEMTWWDKGKPHKTLQGAIESYFTSPPKTNDTDLEGLLG